jgi:hypothetical protein
VITQANPHGAPERDRQFVWLAVAVLIIAALPRFWAAWIDQGVFWPDEIFQSLEQAHRLVFGYGVIPWEFRVGARSWVYPGLIAGLLEVGRWLGLQSGRGIVLLAKTSMACLSLATIYLSMRFAYSLAGRLAALFAGVFGACFSVSILLGSRCSSEMASAPVLIGVVILAAREGRARQLSAGALAGLSIYLRYQNGLLALGVLAILLQERRFKDALEYSAAALLIGVLGGLLDALTWGKPFFAFYKYVKFNLKGSAKRFGAYPVTYYFKVAWNVSGPGCLVIALGVFASLRRHWKLSTLVIAYVLVHCAVPHKEFRFLMPIAPLAFALSAAGLAELFARMRHGARFGVALALACAGMALYTPYLTWEKLGTPARASTACSGRSVKRRTCAA